MTGSPYGETFTRSDIGNGEALSGARVNCLQCGRTANANNNKACYSLRAVFRVTPSPSPITELVYSLGQQSASLTLAVCKLARYIKFSP